MSHPFGRQPDEPVPRCRCCGCTDFDACVDPETGEACHWVAPDLCSACDPSLDELASAAFERWLEKDRAPPPMSWR